MWGDSGGTVVQGWLEVVEGGVGGWSGDGQKGSEFGRGWLDGGQMRIGCGSEGSRMEVGWGSDGGSNGSQMRIGWGLDGGRMGVG